jgi:hypothetical protein
MKKSITVKKKSGKDLLLGALGNEIKWTEVGICGWW